MRLPELDMEVGRGECCARINRDLRGPYRKASPVRGLLAAFLIGLVTGLALAIAGGGL